MAHVTFPGPQPSTIAYHRRRTAPIYGHLGTARHRAEVIEYRMEQHRAILGSRLASLESVVTKVVTATRGSG